MLKLYAWEPSFSYQILRIRDGEINSLKKAAYLNAASTFLWTCAPLLVALSSFTVYVLMDPNNVLDAQTAFVSLTYFNMLRLPLNFLPAMIVYLVQCSVSLKRINAFMNAEELSDDTVTKDTEVPSPPPTPVHLCSQVPEPIVARGASFTWDNSRNQLQDITMKVPTGKLVAVVGTVSSPKDSLPPVLRRWVPASRPCCLQCWGKWLVLGAVSMCMAVWPMCPSRPGYRTQHFKTTSPLEKGEDCSLIAPAIVLNT